MNKIILATRTDKDSFEECKKKLKEKFGDIKLIEKIYIVCDKEKETFILGGVNGEVIYDKKPTRPTVFNKILDKLIGTKRHLLTYSKEVDLRKENIENMIKEVENNKNLIVTGYRLRDNVLNNEEQSMYEKGIAYQVPWNTCALWNKRFVYGKGNEKLHFDEICENDKNHFGELRVKVNGVQMITNYEGMEDGLAIAELVSKNKDLKYKLLGDNELHWEIDNNEERRLKQKIKMARKSIVLTSFINERGYSIDKLGGASL
jgi:hypothetical protein